MFYTVLWNQLIYPRKLSVVFLYLEKNRTKNVQYFFSNSAYSQLKSLTISVEKFLRLMPYDHCYWSLQAITELCLPYHDFFKLCNRWKKKLSDWYNHKETSDAAIENNRLDRLVSSLILTIVATIRKKAIERVPEVFLERLWESYGT